MSWIQKCRERKKRKKQKNKKKNQDIIDFSVWHRNKIENGKQWIHRVTERTLLFFLLSFYFPFCSVIWEREIFVFCCSSVVFIYLFRFGWNWNDVEITCSHCRSWSNIWWNNGSTSTSVTTNTCTNIIIWFVPSKDSTHWRWTCCIFRWPCSVSVISIFKLKLTLKLNCEANNFIFLLSFMSNKINKIYKS